MAITFSMPKLNFKCEISLFFLRITSHNYYKLYFQIIFDTNNEYEFYTGNYSRFGTYS